MIRLRSPVTARLSKYSPGFAGGVFTFILRGAAARVVVEQLQDEALLGESRRLRGRPDRPQLASRKVAPNDVVEIASDGVQFIDKELLLRLEVAELKLKREMRGGRDGGHGTDRFALDRAQFEVAASLILDEAR